jgi:hypothetical protein
MNGGGGDIKPTQGLSRPRTHKRHRQTKETRPCQSAGGDGSVRLFAVDGHTVCGPRHSRQSYG